MRNDKAPMSNPPTSVERERWRAGQAQNSNNKTKILAFRHLYFGIFLVTTLLTLFFFFTSFVYASPFKGPWDQDSSKTISQKQMDHKLNPLRFLVKMYGNYISPIDGKSCPMYPTCSEYSLRCFKKHGFFIGWMMTCDRLFRCGRDELRLSDPLENNDFWWYNGH